MVKSSKTSKKRKPTSKKKRSKRKRSKSPKTLNYKQMLLAAMNKGIESQAELAKVLGLSQQRVSQLTREVFKEREKELEKKKDKAWMIYVSRIEDLYREARESSASCRGQEVGTEKIVGGKTVKGKNVGGKKVKYKIMLGADRKAKASFDRLALALAEKIANANGIATIVGKTEHDVPAGSNLEKLISAINGSPVEGEDDFGD